MILPSASLSTVHSFRCESIDFIETNYVQHYSRRKSRQVAFLFQSHSSPLFERETRAQVMKLLLASLVATVGVFLVASPATVSAQTTIPGRPNTFTLANGGGTFACEDDGSICQVTGDFAEGTLTIGGGRISNVLDGPRWTALDATNDVLTVGVCSGDDCSVTCTYGCTCTQPDDTECPFMVVKPSPSVAPSMASERTTSAPSPSTSSDDGSGVSSWQASTGLALVMGTIVSALLAEL
jgi:hypothetical protein